MIDVYSSHFSYGTESATTNLQLYMLTSVLLSFLGDDMAFMRLHSATCGLVEHGNVYLSRLQREPMQDPEQGVADRLACVTRVAVLGFQVTLS
jgi:hypothetical protein